MSTEPAAMVGSGELSIIYGTAWKLDATLTNVKQALTAGFRAFDTAAQPKHYREDLVGQAVREMILDGRVARGDIYLQTKFCPSEGQDHDNMPYDLHSSLASQVEISIQTSLLNLRPRNDDQSAEEAYIDCLLLHAPLATFPLTMQAWRTMEAFVPSKVRALGVSNVRAETFDAIYRYAKIKPVVVQNKFHRQTDYDFRIRALCQQKGVLYQGFSVITANPALLKAPPVKVLADRLDVEAEVALYGLLVGLGGFVVLNGTSREQRMATDLKGLQIIRHWRMLDENAGGWKGLMDDFSKLLLEV